MNRNGFLILSTLGITVLSTPAFYYYFSDIEYDKSLAQPQSLPIIFDTETMVMIGNKYRTQFPDEKSERKLVKYLLASVPSHKSNLTQTIEQRIKDDFVSGRTVEIDGWILSVTEARQCALLSAIYLK